jgi:hypothetical protein
MRGRMTLGDKPFDCSVMMGTVDNIENYYYANDEPIEIITNRSVLFQVKDNSDSSTISIIMTASQAKSLVKGLKMQIKRCGR